MLKSKAKSALIVQILNQSFVYYCMYFSPTCGTMKYCTAGEVRAGSEVAPILTRAVQNFWIKIDNFLEKIGCLPSQDLPNGEDYKIWLSE